MIIPVSSIFWDPSREIFTIPWINRPLGWYGLLFAFGIFVAYLLMVQFLQKKISLADPARATVARTVALTMADKLCWFAVIGIVVGARLGHVFFYAWPYFVEHPSDIIKVWEGGLASHGGVIGVLIALALYLPIGRRYVPNLSYLALVDLIAIAATFLAGCIRIGNFFNQEIVGTPTMLPWGVVFGHPLDGLSRVPLHPVQLYEAAVYFLMFCCLYQLWRKRGGVLPAGTFTGLVLVGAFGARVLLESVKSTQGELFFGGWLQTGQMLSLPFVLIGAILLWPRKTHCRGT